jgi:hypothetical protein
VWGWDDGVRPPIHHPRTGVSLPWRQALEMPGAYQMAHVAELFEGIEWWRLLPAPELVLDQPGAEDPGRTIVAARTVEGDLAVVYVPDAAQVRLDVDALRPGLAATWFNPRTGSRSPALRVEEEFALPVAGEDSVLVLA